MKDIYFEPDYGKIYEEMEDGESYFFEFSNEYGSISNLFIIRNIPIDLEDDKKYYDITTPYGYGGPIINDYAEGKKEDLIESYYEAFQKFCNENNIVSEFIRFHPVIENAKDFEQVYKVRYLRKTVGTNLKAYDDPFQEEFSKSARKNSRRALRDGVTYEVYPNPDSIQEFKDIYYSTMDRNDADDFYYFDDKYFDKCIKYFKDNILLVKAIYEEETIAMGFYFKYGNLLHTHLSGSLREYRDYSPAYILRYGLTQWGKENGYHLIHNGGGTTNDEDDGLYRFKKRFGENTKLDFHIGTKVWNPSIYDQLCEQVETDKNDDFFPAYRGER